MKSLVLLCLLYLILCPENLFSQDKIYARKVLETLCSPEFHGRGYTHHGDKLASEYIAGELKKMNIYPACPSYLQKFPLSVNSYRGKVSVCLDSKELRAGEDYIIIPYSGSCKGSFPVVRLTDKIIDASGNIDLSGSFVLVDTASRELTVPDRKKMLSHLLKDNPLRARGYIEIVDKKRLTQTIGHSEADFVCLQILKPAVPENISTITLNIKNKFLKDHTTYNVCGILKGKSDSMIVIGAHYDHLGEMGKGVYFPGANDNASGAMMVLNLAKYYSSLSKQPEYTYVFLFFSGEEAGLLGSEYFTTFPLFDLKKVKLMLNLDMVGSGDKGITVVNGSVFKVEFRILDSLNNLGHYFVKVASRGEARNSDHYNFYSHGVKSLFIYTMGEYSEYHNVYDKAESLDLNGFENLFKLLTRFIELQ